jgi:sulfate adenylyltransferase
VSLWADASTREALAASLGAWPSHALTPDQTALLLRLLDGVYAPLDAFPHQSGPTALVIAASTAARLAAPGPLVLREAEGRAVAVMPEATAWQDAVGWHAAGRVVGLQPPPAYDFVDLRLSPDAVRAEIARRGWRDAAAVFADFPFHRAEIAELGRLLGGGPLAFSDEGQPIVRHDLDGIGLVVFASVVAAQAPDTAVYARVRALRAALAHLGSEHVLFVYDGRPEADGAPGSPADATIARAFGCGRLVTWRTPSPALVAAAREAVVAIEHLPAGVPAPLDESPEGRDRWTFPEVAAELARGAPATLPGVTVFFTGLSGSGKSTIANALRVRLLEEGLRTVTLLDGDLVRQHLSSELGFSREHRNLNVRRIAFVAAEITRHGGFAICAPIAPYAAVRHEARAMVERVGTFLLVYVATPLAVCEARDPKGLYQRARAGTLPEFTGVSDPYEVPEDADITLDTSRLSVAASVEVLMAALTERRLLGSATATPRAARDAAPGGASS